MQDKDSKITLWDALSNRRAVREYTTERVPEKTINFLLEQASLAPSAINLQPWAFVIIQKPELLKKISDQAKDALKNDPHWKNAPGHGALHLADENFDIFYGASTLIVICAKSSGPWALGDSHQAAENLMLAAYGIGLGTCPIGLALDTIQKESLKKELGIPSDWTPSLPIIVGFPKGISPKTQRNPPQILSWVRP
jgi:nitroreductase